MHDQTSPMIRSFFIAPANRPDLVLKFPRFRADCSILDLEDGTPVSEKSSAREGLASLVGAVRAAGLSGILGVRVNEPWSDWHLADVEAAAALPIDLLVIPKLEAPDQLFAAVHALRRAERSDDRGRSIMAGIETVRGVARSEQIFNAYPEIRSMYFGAEDFLADIGGNRTRASTEVQFARSSVLLHAKQSGLTAIDQPIADVRDDALFQTDAEQGRQMGYDGKVCLLPRQVEIAHAVFTPSPEEVAQAQRLLDAYADAERRGIGTIEFEGRMIDGPLVKRAQRAVTLGARSAASKES